MPDFSNRPPKTAADLMAELSADADFVRRSREQAETQQELRSALKADEEILVLDLAKVGVRVGSVWDLVNYKGAYRAAIPVLVNHLRRTHHPRTVEGIARALTVPEARGTATDALIERFLGVENPESQLKWVLGKAIAETATADTAPRIVPLVTDRRHGKGRALLPLALRYLPREEVEVILQKLAQDADVAEHAKQLLALINQR